MLGLFQSMLIFTIFLEISVRVRMEVGNAPLLSLEECLFTSSVEFDIISLECFFTSFEEWLLTSFFKFR